MRQVSSIFHVVATLPDATHVLNRARPNPAQRREHFRNEWRQILHAVGGGTHDNDTKRENGDVRLVFEVGIHRHRGIGQATCAPQQGAVPDSCPADTLNGRNGMVHQGVDQVVREVLVKQYAHVSAGFRARARVLRSPVRVGRMETA